MPQYQTRKDAEVTLLKFSAGDGKLGERALQAPHCACRPPFFPGDVLVLPTLLSVLDGWLYGLAIAALGLLAMLALFMLARRSFAYPATQVLAVLICCMFFPDMV